MDLDDLEEALFGNEVSGEEVVVALAVIALGFAVAVMIRRVARRFYGRLEPPADQMLTFIVRALQMTVIAFFLAWALSVLGANVAWLTLVIIALIVIGVLVTRPFLEGLAAFLALSSRSAFKVGDEIGVGDMLGRIDQITARSTVLRLRDGRRIHVPNTDMLGETVAVYTVGGERRSTIDVTVAFGTDLDRVERVVTDALQSLPAVSRIGSVRASSLGEGIDVSIGFWHPLSIEAGNEAIDKAIRAITTAFEQAEIVYAPSATYADYPSCPSGHRSGLWEVVGPSGDRSDVRGEARPADRSGYRSSRDRLKSLWWMISPLMSTTISLRVRTLMIAVTYWWMSVSASVMRLPNRASWRFDRM